MPLRRGRILSSAIVIGARSTSLVAQTPADNTKVNTRDRAKAGCREGRRSRGVVFLRQTPQLLHKGSRLPSASCIPNCKAAGCDGYGASA
jgi:hypothetical protein